MPRPDEHLSPVRPLADGEAERVAERMAAFAAASRVKLLFALLAGEAQVDALAVATHMTPNAVSQQLRVLRHLRVVTSRREGRSVLYRLHDDHIADLLSAVRHQLDHADQGWTDDVGPPRGAVRARG
jgi:DNA-binding transcriptional ArsR family regulator